MDEPRWNLLEEPLIRVSGANGGRRTLPEVLDALWRGDDIGFPALQAHQEQGWYCFLVQLAALVAHRAGGGADLGDASSWRDALLELTGDAHEPWSLVVGDLCHPALLQPPIPERKLEGFKGPFTCPDEIDLLVTAKSHDVKQSRIAHADADHWLFALVDAQTMDGYAGKSHYEIARMNSGYGSRPLVAVTPALSWAVRLRRDVEILLDQRAAMLDAFGYSDMGGLALLWCAPWDGTQTLGLERCDPFFIEVCRRLRLAPARTGVVAWKRGTQARRVEARTRKGDVGDPWIPVDRSTGGALTVSAEGYGYRLVVRLLFGGDFADAPAQVIRSSDPDHLIFIARAMTRGQGKTEGLHQRLLPLPPKIVPMLRRSEGRESLGQRARSRVDDAARAWSKVLRNALRTLLASGSATASRDRESVRKWQRRLDRTIDTVFFVRLWEDAERDDSEAERRWQRELVGIARAVLEEAMDATPVAGVREYRARSAAEGVFTALARRHLPAAFASAVGGES